MEYFAAPSYDGLGQEAQLLILPTPRPIRQIRRTREVEGSHPPVEKNGSYKHMKKDSCVKRSGAEYGVQSAEQMKILGDPT